MIQGPLAAGTPRGQAGLAHRTALALTARDPGTPQSASTLGCRRGSTWKVRPEWVFVQAAHARRNPTTRQSRLLGAGRAAHARDLDLRIQRRAALHSPLRHGARDVSTSRSQAMPRAVGRPRCVFAIIPLSPSAGFRMNDVYGPSLSPRCLYPGWEEAAFVGDPTLRHLQRTRAHAMVLARRASGTPS